MARGKGNAAAQQKIVDSELAALALAKAVYDGDIVNLRLLFMPFSPIRTDSSERFEDEKYVYLLPDDDTEASHAFREALELVRRDSIWRHIERELEANRPARLPWELVLQLGDNAVFHGKFTSASQAYELLRIRRRTQDSFFAQGDKALDEGNLKRAVRAYVIATGLDYDYAAFPEPLPLVPDFQRRALMLHGVYPERIEDSLPLQNLDTFLRIALTYLLLDSSAAARLDSRPREQRVAFLAELVRQRDPDWREFVHRYREACDKMRDFEKRIERAKAESEGSPTSLVEQIETILGEDPRVIPACLLGREIEDGEWWQYLKELAYKHPASVLFVSRNVIGETEIIVPRQRADSPVPRELGLAVGAAASSSAS